MIFLFEFLSGICQISGYIWESITVAMYAMVDRCGVVKIWIPKLNVCVKRLIPHSEVFMPIGCRVWLCHVARELSDAVKDPRKPDCSASTFAIGLL